MTNRECITLSLFSFQYPALPLHCTTAHVVPIFGAHVSKVVPTLAQKSKNACLYHTLTCYYYTMNPLKRARIYFGLSQRLLADELGITPLAVLRYEQGLYENPSEKLTERLEVSPDEYRTWRVMHQESQRDNFKSVPTINSLIYAAENKHPFTAFREIMTNRAVGKQSQIAFCILLAIHPSVVADYENGKMERMPPLVKEALHNAGVTYSYLEELETLGRLYNERVA